MDAKITLSFDQSVIEKAKKYAENNNISLSRLTEFLLNKVTNSSYKSLDELPVSEWVHMVSEGEVEYQRNPRTNKELKKEYYGKKTK
jgi:antitoxin component of RelBE/YafQ-DinJ toxin-antitoxin module